MKRKTIIFQKLLTVIFVVNLVLIGCHRSQVTDILPTSVESHNYSELHKITDKNNLNLMAKSFAKLLSDKEYQKILEDKIKTSQYFENILEATELLNKEYEVRTGDKTEKIILKNKLLSQFNEQESNDFEKWLNGLKFGEVDIYFPVKEHREKWKVGNNLLVVGFLPQDEKEQNSVIAYDLSGTEVLLSTNKAPETPTLVIYPSEKNGSYLDTNKHLNKINSVVNMPSALPPPPPPPGENWYNCTWTGILVAHDYEGWLMGSMEVYLKLKYRYSRYDQWNGWTNNDGVPQHRIDGVDAGHWKRGQVQEILNLPHNFEILVEVWEYDEYPNPDDFIADQYYNVIKECGETGTIYPSNIIRCDFDPCVDFFLQDGVYPSSDYDMVELHFNRRYAE